MPRQPSITIVIHEVHSHGGQERATYELVRRLLERGVEVTVIARRCEVPPNRRLRWIRVRGPSRPFVLAYAWFFLAGSIATAMHGRGFRQTLGAVVLNRVDAAIVQFCHLGYSKRPTAEQRRRPSVLHTLNAYLSSVLSRQAERFCYRPSRVGTLVAVSAGVATELRRCFPRVATRITVIPNGVDPGKFRPDPVARDRLRSTLALEEDDLTAVFVGGDWERKGLPIAIMGIAETADWHLLVVGDGDVDKLRTLASQQGVGGRVHLCGHTPRPERVLPAGDALLFPTSYEGFSLATLEAAATGLPLLVSQVNGTEELVIEGETGWLIDRTPDSVRRALDSLAVDPQLRKRMGERARQIAERYAWDEITRRYESLYAGTGAVTARNRDS